VNTPRGIARADGYEIRAAAVAADKALFTTMAVLGAAVSALPVLREGFDGASLQEYARAERLAEVGR
jgi:carbamoyl-phosphate synthase large subunit